MNGELRYLSDSNIFRLDYYEYVASDREERIQHVREDLEFIFRYASTADIEMFGVDKAEVYNRRVTISNMDGFEKILVAYLTECADVQIDDIDFVIDDEKSRMFFDLSADYKKVEYWK